MTLCGLRGTACWMLAAAGVMCALPLLTWRNEDFLLPEHTIEVGHSSTMPSAATISFAYSTTTYASMGLMGIR